MKSIKRTVGYSSCPNDIFIFEALVSEKLETDSMVFKSVIEDVEALNQRAKRRDLDMTKISFHAFAHLRDTHILLDSGSALGRGCGPLLISKRPLKPEDLPNARIAIPGALTTAALLMRLYSPNSRNLKTLVFDQIIEAILTGDVDAGVIIHESRFTYQSHGLSLVVDLGEWWEKESGLPIPLGGIIADRDLGEKNIRVMDGYLRESIQYAHNHPDEIWESIRTHAQELDDTVIQNHIDLYVTDFTTSLGEEGRDAVKFLFERGEAEGIFPASSGESCFL